MSSRPGLIHSAVGPCTVELFAPNIRLSLLARLDSRLRYESFVTELHNARLAVLGIANELRPR
jgi:hypothetical protein